MPYTEMVQGGAVGALIIILAYLIKTYIDSNNKEKANYEKLVSDVRNESKNREDKLIDQLDKYNTSLQEISNNLKSIPLMQQDINYLKGKVQ